MTEINAVLKVNTYWLNELGSKMHFNLAGPNGEITGWYETAVGVKNPKKRYPLVGWGKGDIISFTVNFEDDGGLTVWAGHLQSVDQSQAEIKTLWYLAEEGKNPEDPSQDWSQTLAGADTFKLIIET